MQKVYVQNKDGEPLMPCKPAKARHLLRDNKADVVQRTPFTIRLLWNCENNTQEVRLGLDTGTTKCGLSALRKDGEVLYQSKAKLRTDTKAKMDRRRMYRRNRRSRKTRHRKPRFDNRKTEEGWLAPSLKSKAKNMLELVGNFKDILPISQINVEIAPFDMQKVKNPDIKGEEYQNGELKGHTSAREYVLYRDKHQCINCKKDNVPLQVHHIRLRRENGSNRPGNLVSLCKDCHKKVHDGDIELSKRSLKYWTTKQYRYASHVNSMKDYIIRKLRIMFDKIKVTFGNITKATRKKLSLDKSDVNDSIAIAGLNFIEKAKKIEQTLIHKFIPKGRYQLCKGIRSEKKIPTKGFFGFNRWDNVQLPSGQTGFIKGRRSSGYFDVSDIDGQSYTNSIKHTKLKLIQRANKKITEVTSGNSSPT